MKLAMKDDATIDNALVEGTTYGSPVFQHELFTQLRRDDPVHWTAPDGYLPFWTISKNADIIEIERQSTLFINAPRNKLFSIDFEEKIREAVIASDGKIRFDKSITVMDGSERRLYRQIAQEWFQPKSINGLQDAIAKLATQSVDELLRLAPKCDFYNDIASRFPLRVIMLILGLPSSDEERLLDITKKLFAGSDPDQANGSDYIDAARGFFEYFQPLYQEKRRNPAGDVATLIANAQVDGKAIEHGVARAYFSAIASAGHDTTSSTAAGGILALIENPAEWDRLKSDPSLIPSAVEEMIRWVSPVKHFFRTATQDYVLRGRQIKAGDNFSSVIPPRTATKKFLMTHGHSE